MDKIISKILISSIVIMCGCSAKQSSSSTRKTMNHSIENASFSGSPIACNKVTEVTCKLTSTELRERKKTVIAGLRKKIIEKRELKNGYAFKFPGNDAVLDELVTFIKTERECCDFFTFGLSVSGDKSETWLELTGAGNTKDFITSELGF